MGEESEINALGEYQSAIHKTVSYNFDQFKKILQEHDFPFDLNDLLFDEDGSILDDQDEDDNNDVTTYKTDEDDYDEDDEDEEDLIKAPSNPCKDIIKKKYLPKKISFKR